MSENNEPKPLKIFAVENVRTTEASPGKKEEVTKLEPLIEEELFIPTQEDIKLAYAELTSLLGVKDDKKDFINKVYQFLFNQEFDWNCRSCVNKQARRFRIHLYGK